MKQQAAPWFCCILAALVLAAAPGAWAVEVGAPTSPETDELGLVPYVPTPQTVVDTMIQMADVKSTDVVFDLGCGDGRIVVAAAKKGARAYGVDIDPQRIKEANENIKAAGVEKRASVALQDVFKTDFSSATVITMYLLPEYNRKLRPKLIQVLPVGARIVSHDFNMPGWKPVAEKDLELEDADQHTVYLWKITAQMKKRAERQAAKQAEGAAPAKRKKAAAPAGQP